VRLTVGLRVFLSLILLVLLTASLCKTKPQDDYLEPVNVSNNPGRSEEPSIAVDSRGTVHLVWCDNSPGNEEILYTMKPAGGSWLEPVQVTRNLGASRNCCIVTDKNDKIHLVWQQCVNRGQFSYWEIFYTWRFAGDTWATPETISVAGSSLCPVLTVDDDLGLHLFWFEGFSYYYAYKPAIPDTASSRWQIQRLFTSDFYPRYEIKVDNEKRVHIVWEQAGEVYYIGKGSDGIWTDTIRISHSPTDWELSILPSFAVGRDGSLHIVWLEGDTALEGIAYLKRTPEGEWLPIISPFKYGWDRDYWGFSYPEIGIGRSGMIYLVWVGAKVGYGIKEGEVWKGPKTIVKEAWGWEHTMAIDPDEKIHVAWMYRDTTMAQDNYEIYYIEFKP